MASARQGSLSARHERSRPRQRPAPAQARLDPGQGAGQRRLHGNQGADAPAQPRHRLRGGGLPEYRRVLDQEARDGDDPRRHLHPRLRLLQRQDRHAARGRSARARACRGRRGRARPHPYRRHLGRPRRSARRRRLAVRQGDRGAAAQHAGDHDRDPDPRFPQQVASRGREDHRGAPRRLQPQSRNGAAPLSDDPARRALLCLAAAARERQAARSVDLHQVGRDGRARRAAARSPSGDGRHALGRRRFPDHGPVSPADPAPRQGRGVRHAGGVQGLCARSPAPRASCSSPPRR